MNKKTHPSDRIRDLMAESTLKGVGGAKGTADLVSGLSDVLHDPSIVEAIAALPADQAEELRQMMSQTAALEELTSKMVAAEAAGDTQTMMELAHEMQEIAPVPELEPDLLEPPYDSILEAIEADDLAALKDALEPVPSLNVHLGRYQSTLLGQVVGGWGEARVPMAKLLIAKGADVTFATPEGYTPLHILTDSGDRDDTVALMDVLVGAGAALEARNHYGWTPLLRAILEGSAAMVKALLERGADVHARYSDASMPPFTRGCTALMGSALEPEKVAILLAHGADPAGSHDDGRGFNAYADTVLQEELDAEMTADLEASRHLVNNARIV